MYASIIIPLTVPQNYTWSIPDALAPKIQVGIRVEVELRNKKYTGIVAVISNQAPTAFTPKPILSILDDVPLIYPHQLELWRWIAQYYMCTQGDVMNAALPSYFKLNSESIVVYNEEYGDDFSMLTSEEYLVAEALSIKKELKLSEVQQLLDTRKIFGIIKSLSYKRVCTVWQSLKDKYVPKQESYVLLHPNYNTDVALSGLLNNWSKAPKQMELLLSYLHYTKQVGIVTKKELLDKAKATDAQLKALVDKGIVTIEKRDIDRLPQLPLHINIDFELSTAQQQAVIDIKNAFALNKNCLLHGVTGSGKTQVYITLINNIIATGKQALYLLPEIALTAQLIRRLQVHFGGHIAVYHSKFSDSERVELWHKVKSGETKIVMGARSALLLPYCNLGLIIIDEEHEPSYKQYDPAPRYHARDTALYYAHLCQAKVLLGSATPSVETYYNCTNGKLVLVPLTQRYSGVALPLIHIVDIKNENKFQKQKVIISQALQEAIAHNLSQKKQVILFKNRRGYTPLKTCSTCGWVPECKYCKVALTYHKNKNQLVCHYCNTIYTTINTCIVCKSQKFEEKSYGTEKVEETVQALFPQARVARMDLDTVKGKNAHSNLIQLFEQGKIDILIGTQMIVKGLDFERVQLVGIVDADSLLQFADFRVHERAFQMMEQVSGRAGRKAEQGLVLIQAMQSGHPILQLVQQHNYELFYAKEIEERRQFYYPPYSRLIHIQFKHKNQAILNQAAEYFVRHIDDAYKQHIIGPAAPFVNRIRNLYLIDILFKLPKDTQVVHDCKAAMQVQFAILYNTKPYNSIVIITNVDPV